MGVLDPERARAVLGERLAGRFLQYASPGDDGDLRLMQLRVDEHLADVLGRGLGEVELANRIAASCKRLLAGAGGRTADERAAILGAVRYFVETHDLMRDDERLGLEDDARVVDYVATSLT
jgi:hypothetical protein